MASAISKLAARVAASKMSPPAPPMSKSSFENGTDITARSNAVVDDEEPSESTAPLFPVDLKASKKMRPIAPIPPFSRLQDHKGKSDLASLIGIDISAEPQNAFTGRAILSKHQMPISEWPMYTSYVANVFGQRNRMPLPASLEQASLRTKREDILDYVYDWAAWAAEISDPDRRSEVLKFVMRTLEDVLRDGMEKTGMVLGPNDVKGTKGGTKRTSEGKVNIQVIITSSTKETVSEKSAAKQAKDILVKYKQAETGGAASLPAEPNPELLRSTEQAAKASLRKAKRAGNQTGHSDESEGMRSSKRQKTEDQENQGPEDVKPTTANDRQQRSAPNNGERLSYDTVSSMSQEEEQKRARYRQKIFRTRLNHILKKAGKTQTRGRCTNWETVKNRLKEAGVKVKDRNLLLHDFHSGHEAWDGDSNIDPDEELAHFAEYGFEKDLNKASVGNASVVEARAGGQVVKDKETHGVAALPPATENLPAFNADISVPGGFMPAQPVSSPHAKNTRTHKQRRLILALSQANLLHHPQLLAPTQPAAVEVEVEDKSPKKLIVTIPTFPGFDPDDYSLYNQYQHENFMFSFAAQSTVRERVQISDVLIRNIDAKLDDAVENGVDVLESRKLLIRNPLGGKVVAKGNFVDLNSHYMVLKGMADPQKPWMWKGRTFRDEVVPVERVG